MTTSCWGTSWKTSWGTAWNSIVPPPPFVRTKQPRAALSTTPHKRTNLSNATYKRRKTGSQ